MGPDPLLHLAPMSVAAFDAYLARSIPEYAQEKVKAGTWEAEDALRLSREGFGKLLPDGVSSPGHLLFEVVESASQHVVGVLGLYAKAGYHFVDMVMSKPLD